MMSMKKTLMFVAAALFVWHNLDASARRTSLYSTLTAWTATMILREETNATTTTTTTTSNDTNATTRPIQSLLSLDWGNLQVLSDLGRRMLQHQQNCSALSSSSLYEFRFRNRFGMGSDLHLWSTALCNAMELQGRIVTRMPQPWLFWDTAACGAYTPANQSVLECYFARPEQQCRAQDDMVLQNTTRIPQKLYMGRGNIYQKCPGWMANYTKAEWDGAAMEVLFTSIKPIVVQEAQRQLQRVFLGNVVPKNLITVHIRWGDKGAEMRLVSIPQYIQAVEKLAGQLDPQRIVNQTIPVYLATEDPRAVQAFLAAAPPHFDVYMEDYYRQFESHRVEGYNGNPHMTRALQGAPGRIALASILLALEGTGFVVTTASNWSRLLDELRRFIVHPRRRTAVVDLRPWRG